MAFFIYFFNLRVINITFVLELKNRFKYRIYSYGKANRLNLLTDFLFYAKLKQVNDHGYFLEGNIHSSIEQKIKMSRTQISKRLKSLIDNDFAVNVINQKTGKRLGIKLRSYRYIYTQIFGLIYNKKELYNIIYKDVKDLKAQICSLEQYHHEIEKNRLNDKRELLKKTESEDNISDQSVKPNSKVEPRTSEISCSTIASRLGYDNPMAGFRMKELARKKRYIKQNKNLVEHGFLSLTTGMKYNTKKDKESLKTVNEWLETGLLSDRRFFTVKKGKKVFLYERKSNIYYLKKLSLLTQREKKNKVSKYYNEALIISKKYSHWSHKDYYLSFLNKDEDSKNINRLLEICRKKKLDVDFFCPWL